MLYVTDWMLVNEYFLFIFGSIKNALPQFTYSKFKFILVKKKTERFIVKL